MATYPSSGFRAFAEKLGHPPQRLAVIRLFEHSIKRGREQVYALHDRVLEFRELSLESLSFALAYRLLDVDTESAQVNTLQPAAERPPQSKAIREMVEGARRLGELLATSDLPQTAQLLKVTY